MKYLDLCAANVFTEMAKYRIAPYTDINLALRQNHLNEIDHAICAEILDADVDNDLYEVVMKNMIHGPCSTVNPNLPMHDKGNCFKRYSRSLISNTITRKDRYPLCRRRSAEDGEKLTTIQMWNGEIELDNREALIIIENLYLQNANTQSIGNGIMVSMCGCFVQLHCEQNYNMTALLSYMKSNIPELLQKGIYD
ncbi:unnamed protein product [Onchocerca ochengi]|uniref:Ankyrin repeat protein n=1 Tax=Onchocerca ochengi TaxID=42157 RepID=A0A182EFX5_ONCOC|nr:unnamed protein product [Onchocerca ochengi]